MSENFRRGDFFLTHTVHYHIYQYKAVILEISTIKTQKWQFILIPHLYYNLPVTVTFNLPSTRGLTVYYIVTSHHLALYLSQLPTMTSTNALTDSPL